MKRLEIAAVVLAILAIVGVPTAALAYERSQRVPDEITVVARQVEHGGWSPSTIALQRGQLVRLRITSTDVVHSLYIKELDLDSGPIYPGHWVRMEFRVQGDGELRIKCDIACGLEHTKMSAKLIVGGGAAAAAPAEPEAPPLVSVPIAPSAPAPSGDATPLNDPLLALGKKVFETAGGDGCQDCHGPDARGRATKNGTNAPNIRGATEKKLREALAGGAALMTFLKKELSDEDIDAVIKYLQYLNEH
jgi:mono/diheme cytochrome c family protein